MQERDFIPSIGMTTTSFWTEVSAQSQKHSADNILIYMWLMLKKAEAASIPVRAIDFEAYGKKIDLFEGVLEWFPRINKYAKESGVNLTHHIISSGIREMILGTPINKHFSDVFASSFCYDHHGIAKWPALALNYTTKTQYLFRINKGVDNVHDHSKINEYTPPAERPVPFSNMVFIGDGETDVPCFRLVRSQGGHSIAVYKPNTTKGKKRAEKLIAQGRVSYMAPADYRDGRPIDRIAKAIIDKISVDDHLDGFVTK
jgi:hypothetical protein